MKKKNDKVRELFESARSEGKLSAKSMQSLHIVDLGAQIQAGLGVDIDDVDSSEVVLVTMMPDDSSSIRMAGNADAVRAGHNMVLEALGDSKQRDDVFVHTRYLNGTVLYPYTTLSEAIPMDEHNYDPRLATPLYDQSVVVLGTVLAKAQEFAACGVPARTVTLIISDGVDYGSQRAKASDVKNLVEDLLRAEDHVVAAMGIDDGQTDFRAVFRSMGIPDEWILTPKNTGADIRKAFQVFSQSAIRGPAALSGGFFN